MAEYIEREAAIAVIYGQHVGGKDACENARPNTYGADLREIVADIEDIPAADVVPIRHGKWVGHDIGGIISIDNDACSECGSVFYQIAETGCVWNFCPNCGADMREES